MGIRNSITKELISLHTLSNQAERAIYSTTPKFLRLTFKEEEQKWDIVGQNKVFESKDAVWKKVKILLEVYQKREF